MPDARRDDIDAIIGRSLLTAETLASGVRREIVSEIASLEGLISPTAILAGVRSVLDGAEPVLAQAMLDAELAAWIAGTSSVAGRIPESVLNLLTGPRIDSAGTAGELLSGSVIRFPAIERAAEDLLARNIVSRPDFDILEAAARDRAFTVARLDSLDAIETVRDVLAETVTEGASLEGFRHRLSEAMDGSRLGPAHLETVYRTNIQSAFTEGHDQLAADPIIEEVFPFREYLPIDDGRVREQHLLLGSLGLDGTGVYWAADPFWQVFRIPWDYNCRCGSNLLTLEQAARKGVVAARQWQRTGNRPEMEFRLDQIPFRPPAGFERAA
jgi:hypothetical protein